MLAYSPVKAQDCAGKVGVHTFMTLVLRHGFILLEFLDHIFRHNRVAKNIDS